MLTATGSIRICHLNKKGSVTGLYGGRHSLRFKKVGVEGAWLFVIPFPEMRSRSPISRNDKMKRETDLGLPKTPSRGGKPIKIFQKCQNEAGNGVKSPKNAFPRREMGEIFRKTVLCDGKPIKFLRKRSCAAGRRLKFSEIVFVRREMGLFSEKRFPRPIYSLCPSSTCPHTIRYRAIKKRGMIRRRKWHRYTA